MSGTNVTLWNTMSDVAHIEQRQHRHLKRESQINKQDYYTPGLFFAKVHMCKNQSIAANSRKSVDPKLAHHSMGIRIFFSEKANPALPRTPLKTSAAINLETCCPVPLLLYRSTIM